MIGTSKIISDEHTRNTQARQSYTDTRARNYPARCDDLWIRGVTWPFKIYLLD